MDVLEGDQHILSAPVSVWQHLPAGRYSISERQMAARSGEQYGAAWALAFGDHLQIAGAYWHNRFGTAHVENNGTALEITPALAHWIYPRATEVIIF
jgi:hypothetical protein